MKYLFAAMLLFAFTQCAPTKPVKIAGYDVSDKDKINYSDIPCHTSVLVHAADTFEDRRIINAYKLSNHQGYLLQFKDRKGDDKLTYIVETDAACNVMKVTTAFK